MEAVLYIACAVLTVDVLCVPAQDTGTEMPCEDLGPSPSTPTSGKIVHAYMSGIYQVPVDKKKSNIAFWDLSH